MSHINKEKKQQDLIIDKHKFRIQVDLRRALLPITILFFIKERPHYSLELQKKISSISIVCASFAEKKLKMGNFDQRGLRIHKEVIYNNLNKLEKRGILGSYKEKSPTGPKRKYYYLTEFGHRFFDEVIVEKLYPPMFMFLTFMEAGLHDKRGKLRFSKKEMKDFQKLYNNLVE